ncbi:MAG TPA: sigma 54-interacting transcriptional regulator [Ramlibacter sp.]|uniref:sigma-54-dependent transcriptional regulator n=1 Tax=Ramlibacter sp. TaxID=1917967 RepID=UPI002BA3A980|nr:sigma 54-interacting transcriptional regulator [Ramlibacter sp.]HVZ44665.1 sigma 54-interacting transcriptional regulator [Ramlibacter sp.]
MSTPRRKLLQVASRPGPADLLALLADLGWDVVHAKSLKAARALMRGQDFLVALLAIEAGAREFTQDFEALRECSEACEWVALLPRGALESCEWLRELVLHHVFDYHTHPADPRFLGQSLGHAWGRAMLRRRCLATAADDLGLVGRSAVTAQLRRLVRRSAASDACVLIEGEYGTGKARVARALHACSSHAAGPFVAIDCATLGEDAHERFARAAGGTLFLADVAHLTLGAQARLVRFLAEQSVLRTKLGRDGSGATRVVAACETSLAEAVHAKRFRQDLFFRLSVIPLTLSPLRLRKEDIEPLAHHFRSTAASARASIARGFSRRALAAMKEHAWPGNVRELSSRVRRALVLAERRLIGPEELGLEAKAAGPIDSLQAIRVQAEKDAVALSLDRASQNVSLAARDLGVSRMTMYRLMAKHSITPRASA